MKQDDKIMEKVLKKVKKNHEKNLNDFPACEICIQMGIESTLKLRDENELEFLNSPFGNFVNIFSVGNGDNKYNLFL